MLSSSCHSFFPLAILLTFLDTMEAIGTQTDLGNGVGVEKFFAGREALIAQEKLQRSGKALLISYAPSQVNTDKLSRL